MFLIDNILKLVIIFVGISLSVFFILLITFHVVEKQERAECRLWQEQANKYPEIISRILEEGHILGTHFLKHRTHILDTKAIFLNSLNESIQKIEAISRNTIHYCRIPYGRLFSWQEKWINDCNCEHVFWSLDSKDYLHESADSIIHRIRSKMQANDIVLFHDGENSHPEIVKIVEECLKSLNFDL